MRTISRRRAYRLVRGLSRKRQVAFMIIQHNAPPIATIALNDPSKRNALSLAMFDALDEALAELARDDAIHTVLLRGEGPAFCAGFDMGAAVDDPQLLPQFILRLSALNRALRRMPQVVVAEVHGAAIAGGCAILSACDFVFVAPDAKLGYPVHAMGISPAVAVPTLRLALGDGATRALLMAGDLISGVEAHRRGLATHVADSSASVHDRANAHCHALAQKGPQALRTTKAWLNELDGSAGDEPFDRPAKDSAAAARATEAQELLAAFWLKRKA
jgi:methylglutaconyl-CoA hydratase